MPVRTDQGVVGDDQPEHHHARRSLVLDLERVKSKQTMTTITQCEKLDPIRLHWHGDRGWGDVEGVGHKRAIS